MNTATRSYASIPCNLFPFTPDHEPNSVARRLNRGECVSTPFSFEEPIIQHKTNETIANARVIMGLVRNWESKSYLAPSWRKCQRCSAVKNVLLRARAEVIRSQNQSVFHQRYAAEKLLAAAEKYWESIAAFTSAKKSVAS